MKAHKFSSTTKVNSFQLKDFLGVDFTTHESEVNVKRSPDAINMIAGKSGSMDKRYGFKGNAMPISWVYSEDNSEQKINLYHEDTYAYSSTLADIDYRLVQVGSSWYFMSYEDMVYQRVQQQTTSGAVDFITQNKPSNIVMLKSQNSGTASHNIWLVQNNWQNDQNNDLLIIFMYKTIGNPMYCLAYNLYTDASMLMLGTYESYVKYPTTSIARTPAGIGTDYEASNLLTKLRENSFLSDGTSVNYYVDATLGYTVQVTQMQSDGTFSTNLHNSSGGAITYTTDSANKRIVFSAVPHSTYKTGSDNIIVRFSTASTFLTSFTSSGINLYESIALFGLNSSDDYLFMCNNSSGFKRNMEQWLNVKMPIYLSENDYSRLGTTKKVGYSNYGTYLVLHAEKYANEPTMYLKNATLDEAGEIVFTNTFGESSVGAIAGKSFANLRDDPLWLSEAGINALTTNAITNITSIQDRGFYINDQLLKETNLEDAISFVHDNKYFIILGKHIYIADPRKKYTQNLAYAESYQYDWYFWIIPFNVISYQVVDGTLYLGSDDNYVYRYKNDSDDLPYTDIVEDSVYNYTFWNNHTNYVFGDFVMVYVDGINDTYHFCIKDHNSSTIDTTNEFYWISITHESISGDTMFLIPVYSYWTTPIMNMGNITMLKTLKNLWVRLGKYAHMSTRIYYSTKGLIKEEYDGVFDFSDIDFSRFVFSSDTDPSVMVTNRTERKFMSIQFKVESRTADPFSLLEIVGKYITNSQYKGR